MRQIETGHAQSFSIDPCQFSHTDQRGMADIEHIQRAERGQNIHFLTPHDVEPVASEVLAGQIQSIAGFASPLVKFQWLDGGDHDLVELVKHYAGKREVFLGGNTGAALHVVEEDVLQQRRLVGKIADILLPDFNQQFRQFLFREQGGIVRFQLGIGAAQFFEGEHSSGIFELAKAVVGGLEFLKGEEQYGFIAEQLIPFFGLQFSAQPFVEHT